MKIIEMSNVSKVYGNKENSVKALNNISFSVEQGEFIAIVGASGSGKSTLLNLLGGLDTPTSGKIIIDNNDLSKLSKNQLTVFRRRSIGFVFQNYSLLPILNAYDNIALPGILDKGRSTNKKKIKEIMQNLSIWEKRDKYPNELSGGQQQRIAIARALSTTPALILADEPTGNLDSKNSMEVILLLKHCSKLYNQTIIMVTHNEELAQMCDRVVCIEDGTIKKEA